MGILATSFLGTRAGSMDGPPLLKRANGKLGVSVVSYSLLDITESKVMVPGC